jgi:hypothetical protein
MRKKVVFIAYRATDGAMLPLAQAGRLVTFPSLQAAKEAAGALGVGAPVTWARVTEICRWRGLELPERPTKGRPRQAVTPGGAG